MIDFRLPLEEYNTLIRKKHLWGNLFSSGMTFTDSDRDLKSYYSDKNKLGMPKRIIRTAGI